MKSKSILVPYLILTLGLTWLLWWGIVLANQFGALTFGTPPMMILYILGGNMPPIIAIILLLKTRETPARKLFCTIFVLKQKPLYYLLVLAAVAVSYAIPFLFGAAHFTAPLYIALLALPLMILGGGLEEIGWRMILQPHLEKRLPFTLATLITAVIWSLWHLPLFFIQGTSQCGTDFLLFAVTALGLSFILAAIRRITDNVWLCILLHTLWNALGASIKIENTYLSALVAAAVLIGGSYAILHLSKNQVGKIDEPLHAQIQN